MMHHLSLAMALLMLADVAGAQPMPAAGDPPPAKADAPPEPTITNPLVTSLLETRPSKPDDVVRTIDTLIELKHAAFAKPLLNQLLAANLDEATLAALGKQYGTPTFLRFATLPDLQPEGRQVADAVLSAYSKRARDPDRIAGLIARLPAANPQTRQLIYSDLRSGGSASALALIGALADPARAAEHADFRTALVALDSLSVGPLLGVLQAPEAALRTHAADVLRRVRATEAAPYLAWPAYAPHSTPELKAAAMAALDEFVGHPIHAHEAASLAYTQARRDYAFSVRRDDDGRELRDVWRWDAEANQPAMTTITAAEAALHSAVQLGRDLHAWYPNSAPIRRLYLGALLELAARQAGIDQPVPTGPGTAHDEAAALGVAGLYDLLDTSMRDGHLAAATAAAQMLGELGTPELLHDVGPRPSALVEAARHGDRRLRFAALEAIFRLRPSVAYPGSSQVLHDLALIAGHSGTAKALVIDARAHEARRLATLLAPLDYEVDVATDGRRALALLNASADYALVLLDYRLPSTNIDELLQQLRRDHRTSALPVALVAAQQDQLGAAYLAERDPRTFVVARAQDVAGMQFQVETLLARVPRRLAPEERLEQARRALTHLAALAAQPQPLYDLQRTAAAVTTALYVPELTALAAPLLADLGTPQSQQTLSTLASRGNFPLDMRQAAAAAFQRAVRRYGVLLTTGEIQAQYARYNQSETESPESQQVLGSILDTIERRPASTTEPATAAEAVGEPAPAQAPPAPQPE